MSSAPAVNRSNRQKIVLAIGFCIAAVIVIWLFWSLPSRDISSTTTPAILAAEDAFADSSLPENVSTEINKAAAVFNALLVKHRDAKLISRNATWAAGLLALIIAGITTFSALQAESMENQAKVLLAILSVVVAICTWVGTESSKQSEIRLTGATEIKTAIVELTSKVKADPDSMNYQGYIPHNMTDTCSDYHKAIAAASQERRKPGKRRW